MIKADTYSRLAKLQPPSAASRNSEGAKLRHCRVAVEVQQLERDAKPEADMLCEQYFL